MKVGYRVFILLFCQLLAGRADGFDWLDYLEQENVLNKNLLDSYIEGSEYLKPGWIKNGTFSSILKSLDQKDLKEVKTCGDHFYPAHPYSSTKEYHGMFYQYYTRDLPWDSEACLVHSNGKRKFCLNSDYVKLAIISDTYIDSCGKYFRAFWLAIYSNSSENIGTLLSRGRSIKLRPNSNFPKDYISSNTFGFDQNYFFLTTDLFPNDLDKIKKLEAKALNSFYEKDGLEFSN